MANDQRPKKQVTATGHAASGGDAGSRLLPMLVGGLILIAIGAVVIMVFV